MVHSRAHFTDPAPRRVECLVMVRNPAGAVLVVKPSYRSFPSGECYQLPGGGANPNEMPHVAALRELVEETRLGQVKLGPLLIIDYVLANHDIGSKEGINFVFDGGVVPEDVEVRLPEPLAGEKPELVDWRFVPQGELEEWCQPYQARRIRQALVALADPAERGYRVEGRAA